MTNPMTTVVLGVLDMYAVQDAPLIAQAVTEALVARIAIEQQQELQQRVDGLTVSMTTTFHEQATPGTPVMETKNEADYLDYPRQACPRCSVQSREFSATGICPMCDFSTSGTLTHKREFLLGETWRIEWVTPQGRRQVQGVIVADRGDVVELRHFDSSVFAIPVEKIHSAQRCSCTPGAGHFCICYLHGCGGSCSR